MSKKVYVANLPSQATEPKLNVLFSKAGSVMSVKIVKGRQIGQPGVLLSWRCQRNGKPGELLPC
jgi:RNA recognition motif-containing protein